ncbi:MAG TPA: hypothetical protein P5049_04580 [Methanothrix sp.]|nr:hypothetical protein [Methanothrix sp.]
MLKLKYIIIFLTIVCVHTSIGHSIETSQGDIDIDKESVETSQGRYDISDSNNDNSNPSDESVEEPVTSSLTTHSSGTYTVSPQGQIRIDKYFKGFAENYDKNENIIIQLRVINGERRNRLENIDIIEEIPEGFELVDAHPDPDYLTPNEIWWHPDYIGKRKYFNYTVRTNKSGKYVFSGTILGATVKDPNGRTFEILQSYNNDIFVNIINKKPEVKLNITPQNISKGWDLNDKSEFIIPLIVTDEDKDVINVHLEDNYKNTNIEIHPKYDILEQDNSSDLNVTKHRFILNSSDYEDSLGIHRFNSVAKDNDESSDTETVEIDIYKTIPHSMQPSTDTMYSIIFGIVGIIIGFITGAKKGGSKRSDQNGDGAASSGLRSPRRAISSVHRHFRRSPKKKS